ncbi:MAG: MECDP-synthase [Marinobacter sp.]|nr:MECDP-synthase [Marinobacter sp.]
MFKKTLLSLAVASTVGLTGCFDDAKTGANADPDYKINDTTIDTSLVRPVFNPFPTSPEFSIPANFDLVLLLGAGQSSNYDFTGFTTGSDPASTAISDMVGFSTAGQIDIRFDGSLAPATVVAGQSVFLIPLNMLPVSASTPDVELTGNPSYINTADPFDLTKYAAQNIRTEVISLDGGSNNVIRVTPLEPLEDQTKYLVLVTDAVTGADGQPTEQSTAFSQLAGDGPLGTSSFQSIRDLIQGGVGLAEGWLGANGIDNDVTLAYTVTTSNTKTVLSAITSPATYLTQLGQEMVLYSALQVVRDNLPDGSTASAQFAALADALSASPVNTDLAGKVAQAIGPYIADPSLVETIVGSVVPDMPFPQPRTTAVYDATTQATSDLTAIANSGNAALIAAGAAVNVSEGAIELPYYLELPGAGGAGLVTGMWRGSTDLESGMNDTIDALKGSNPTLSNFQFPRDSDGTFNVTQYMPFPQENARVVAPFAVFYPNPAAAPNCADGGGTGITDVVVFQHGLTRDRSLATIPAINLTAQTLASSLCVVTIAMDQPLHGLGGATVGTVPGLTPAANYVDPADFPDADFIGERHFNFSTPAGSFAPQEESDIRNVRSGSLGLNLASLTTTRDNLRQAVVDLMNLSATAANGAFDIDGAGTDYSATSLQGANFHFIGYSLGGMSGVPYAALAEDATLRAAYGAIGLSALYPDFASISLMNTGGHLSKLGENSAGFSPLIIGGLASAGVNQGSSSFETFLYAWQSAMDSTDPVNYAKWLGGSVAAEGATGLLMSEVVGDLTVPNEANVAPLGQALSAPLAGSEPFMALVNLGAGVEPLTSGNIVSASSPVGVSAIPNASSFFFGGNPCVDARHGTFVVPVTPPSEEDTVCPNGSDTSEAFAEMITEVIGNVTAQSVPVVDSTVLGDSPTIGSALDQN